MHPEIAVWTGVGQSCTADGSGAACRAQVDVLPGGSRAGRLVEPHLAWFQQSVVVCVATHERRKEIIRRVARCAVIVAHYHAGDRLVPGVPHLVGPSDRAAHRNQWPRRCVIVGTVGQLDDLHPAGDIERKIGKEHGGAARDDRIQAVVPATDLFVVSNNCENDRAHVGKIGGTQAGHSHKFAEVDVLRRVALGPRQPQRGLGSTGLIAVDRDRLDRFAVGILNLQHKRILDTASGQVDAAQAGRIYGRVIPWGSVPNDETSSVDVCILRKREQVVVFLIDFERDSTGALICAGQHLSMAAKGGCRRHRVADAGRAGQFGHERLESVVERINYHAFASAGVIGRDDDGASEGHRRGVEVAAGFGRLHDEVGACGQRIKTILTACVCRLSALERVGRGAVVHAVRVAILVQADRLAGDRLLDTAGQIVEQRALNGRQVCQCEQPAVFQEFNRQSPIPLAQRRSTS